jgi:ATP-dependent DNA helicase RecQ
MPSTSEIAADLNRSMDEIMEAARGVLKDRWGFDDFRADQARVLRDIFSGKDVLAVLPTGYGKSVCFQIPAMIAEGSTLVISPLIALMKDQVDDCNARGIPATYVNSHVDEDERTERLDDFIGGSYKLLYVAPERLRSKEFLATIRSAHISYLVVDEAHCASMWGHDFRPMYSRIKLILDAIGEAHGEDERPQVIAVTATATADIEDDIAESIGMRDDYVRFVGDPVRPNIKYEVCHTNEWSAINRIARAFDTAHGRYIVYVGTRAASQKIAEIVERQLYPGCVGFYHGGMRKEEREKVQNAFKDGKLPVIVATCAFGMGIDVPNIREVVHFGIPGSLEAYVQESGRAGRDGKNSRAILLNSDYSYTLQQAFLEEANPPYEAFECIWEYLHLAVTGPREQLSLSCAAISAILKSAGHCIESGVVRTVLNMMEKNDLVVRAYAGSGATLLVDKEQLGDATGKVVTKVAAELADLATGQLQKCCELHIDRASMASKLGMSKLAFSRALSVLNKKGIIRVERQFRGKTTRVKQWLAKLEDFLPREEIEAKRARELKRFAQMCAYVHAKDRAQCIRDYFQKGF